MVKGGSKFIPLETLKEIKENQYRSKCGKFEFAQSEIDFLISEKESKELEKEYKRLMKMTEQKGA